MGFKYKCENCGGDYLAIQQEKTKAGDQYLCIFCSLDHERKHPELKGQ